VDASNRSPIAPAHRFSYGPRRLDRHPRPDRHPRRQRLPRPARPLSALATLASLATFTTLAAIAATVPWIGSTAAPAGAATAPTTTTTTTSAPSAATLADKWILKAVAAEQHFGSVQVAGKITQGKSQILLQLLVNADGEGGGEFVQQGNLIKIERVGPLLYFNAPTKFWTASHATAAQTKTYGGKWIELSAVDPRFTSFDQFLDAADLVVAAFQGHTTPLTVGRPTTFAGHKVVVVKDTVTSNGKRSTGLMYIAATGPALVYKIVNDTPGDVSMVVFDHYGKGATLTVPPNAINLS